jgi:hypothetical protein
MVFFSSFQQILGGNHKVDSDYFCPHPFQLIVHRDSVMAEVPYEFAQSLQTNDKIVSQLGHDHFLQNPSQFIISPSFFHSTLFIRNY